MTAQATAYGCSRETLAEPRCAADTSPSPVGFAAQIEEFARAGTALREIDELDDELARARSAAEAAEQGA